MIAWLWWRVLAFFLARYELIRAPDCTRYLSRWHFPRWLARYYDAEQLFLHRFHQSDPDRGWHNHPWTWCESRLLRGAYTQEVRSKWGLFTDASGRVGRWIWATSYQDFCEGDRNRLTHEYHRVLLATLTAWTLFRTGPKHGKSWGFIDDAGTFTPANGGMRS